MLITASPFTITVDLAAESFALAFERDDSGKKRPYLIHPATGAKTLILGAADAGEHKVILTLGSGKLAQIEAAAWQRFTALRPASCPSCSCTAITETREPIGIPAEGEIATEFQCNCCGLVFLIMAA